MLNLFSTNQSQREARLYSKRLSTRICADKHMLIKHHNIAREKIFFISNCISNATKERLKFKILPGLYPVVMVSMAN